jgi:hypothetical protein
LRAYLQLGDHIFSFPNKVQLHPQSTYIQNNPTMFEIAIYD